MAKRYYFTAENEDNEIWEHCGNIRGAKTIGKKLANEYNQTIYINDVDGEEIVEVIEPDEVVDCNDIDNISEEADDSKEGDNNTMDRFYKGYVPGRDKDGEEKSPTCSFTNPDNLKTKEECQKFDNVIGVLNDDVALYDADSEPHSTILMKIVEGENLRCRATDRDGGRGKHFNFLNDTLTTCKDHITLACGIVVDIKLGCKNGLECLKFKGVERITIYDKQPYQTIPKYLYPLKNCKVDFTALSEGDGRNSALYSHILTLQNNGFTIEEIKATIQIMNKYVLKKPLPEKEIETILRDDAFKKQAFYDSKNKFLHDKFASFLKNNNHIIRINKQLHIYVDGVYTHDIDVISNIMRQNIPHIKRNQKTEVLDCLNDIAENKQLSDARYIPFKNGILDMLSGILQPHSPDIIITNKIPWNYNPNASSNLIEQTLNKISCNDISIRALLEEMIGYCFYRSNAYKKSFILTGGGNNGKSTLLDVIKVILGENNICALDLKEIGERFKTADLFGKLANIGDDITDDFIQGVNVSLFKKIGLYSKFSGYGII